MTENNGAIPEPAVITFDNFPEPLTTIRRWSVFKLGSRNPATGKFKKTVCMPNGSHPCPPGYPDVNNPEHFGTLQDVMKICNHDPSMFVPAFRFTPDLGLLVLDFDYPRDTAKMPPPFETYTEKSLSGGGCHVICRYSGEGFPTIGEVESLNDYWVVITGDLLEPDCPAKKTIADLTTELQLLVLPNTPPPDGETWNNPNWEAHAPDGTSRSIADEYGLQIEDFCYPINGKSRGDGEVQGGHPVHGSTTGHNFSINVFKQMMYCFRCKVGGDRLQAFAMVKGIIQCHDIKHGCLDGKWEEVFQALEKAGYKKHEDTTPKPKREKPIVDIVLGMFRGGMKVEAVLAAALAINTASEKPASEMAIRGLVEFVNLKYQSNLAMKEAKKAAIAEAMAAPPPAGMLLADGIETLIRDHHQDYAIAKSLNHTIGMEAGDNDIARYCPNGKDWYIWDGARWQKDEKHLIEQIALTHVCNLMKEACDLKKIDLQKQIIKSEGDTGIRSALSHLTKMVSVAINDFDTDLTSLNVLNGTIDLKTQTLLPFSKQSMITKLAPVTYQEGAKCPKWEEHLNRVFCGNTGLILAIQRAAGYSLLGGNAENKFFILFGGGQNGKSVTTNVITKVIGDYGLTVDASTFYIRTLNSGEARSDLARMKGARMITTSEGTASKQFDESLLKKLTGGDPVTARFQYGREFTFTPTGTIWYHTNHLPKIKDRDFGIWRRPYPIPFNAVIPVEDRIKDYDKILFEEEGSGILNWILSGLKDYLKANGGKGDLLYPPEVTTALENYKIKTDDLGEFLQMYEITRDTDDRILRNDLWSDYLAFIEGEIKHLRKKDFNDMVEDRIGEAKRFNNGVWWVGIKKAGQPQLVWKTTNVKESGISLAGKGEGTGELYKQINESTRKNGSKEE